MASPLEIFRKPHEVRVFTGSTLVKGVLVPGVGYDTTITCSVQRIGKTQAEELTTRGKRLSDFRRIYTSSRLPISEEEVTGVSRRTPNEDELVVASGEVIDVIDGKGVPARVKIDGLWYAVQERHPMQNGVINHYQYLLYRVIENDQNL